jgi:hypothetical protein
LRSIGCGNLNLMKVWMAILLLLAPVIFWVTRWLRGLFVVDDEPWDFESERLLDQAMVSMGPATMRAPARQPAPR